MHEFRKLSNQVHYVRCDCGFRLFSSALFHKGQQVFQCFYEKTAFFVIGQSSTDASGRPTQTIQIFIREFTSVHYFFHTFFDHVTGVFPIKFRKRYHQIFHGLKKRIIFGILNYYFNGAAVFVCWNQNLNTLFTLKFLFYLIFPIIPLNNTSSGLAILWTIILLTYVKIYG